jgi:DNA-binding MarR family transcriptional regulator
MVKPMMSQQPELESTDFLLAQICRMHHSRAHVLLEKIGLYRGQPPLLRILHEEEGLTHTELATRLHVVPATVTKMLQRMEKAGFVSRRPDPEDQRVSRVYLTDAGREIQFEMVAVLHALAEETFAGFTLEERDLLWRLLLQVHTNLVRVTE